MLLPPLPFQQQPCFPMSLLRLVRRQLSMAVRTADAVLLALRSPLFLHGTLSIQQTDRPSHSLPSILPFAQESVMFESARVSRPPAANVASLRQSRRP